MQAPQSGVAPATMAISRRQSARHRVVINRAPKRARTTSRTSKTEALVRCTGVASGLAGSGMLPGGVSFVRRALATRDAASALL